MSRDPGDQTNVLKLDALDPSSSLLIPYVMQRVMDYSRKFAPEMSPRGVAKLIGTQLAQGLPTQLVLALVDPVGKVVGHAVAQLAMDEENVWVTILQIKADGNVGTAMRRAIEMIEDWAARQGATITLLMTGRSDKKFEDELGFELQRQIKARPLTVAV